MSWRPVRHVRGSGDHERARELTSWALLEPLSEEEAGWLAIHLDGCPDCATAAAEFAAQSAALRTWSAPEPPRDLWARTAVALDGVEEPAATTGRRARAPRTLRPVRRRYSPAALGSFAAVFVVAVVVGASWLSTGFLTVPGSRQSPIALSGSAQPGATPLTVASGPVSWVARNADGTYALNQASVQKVCPSAAREACAPLDSSARELVSLATQPDAVIMSSQGSQAVVVGEGATKSGGSVYVVTFSPSSTPSPGASATPRPVVTPAPTPTTSSSPSGPASPIPTLTPTPTPTPSHAASPRPTPSGPSGSPGTSPSPSPSASPGQTQNLAIASDVVVVGSSGSYSADGAYFAFSARPADGTAGPDIYVWRVGDPAAHRVTDDHASIFSSWLGDFVLGSDVVITAAQVPDGSSLPGQSTTTPTGSPGPGAPQSPVASTTGPTAVPRSFLLDPTTGAQAAVGLGVWRPVVDPTQRYVAYWNGTLRYDAASSSWVPAQGDLFLGSWTAPTLPVPSASPAPSGGAGSTPQPSVSASPSPSGPAAPGSMQPIPTQSLDVDPGVPADTTTLWDVRWDASGEHLATWVAGPVDSTIGRISLVTLDPSTGLIDTSQMGLLTGSPALPGFSIGSDRLAWATPPGQDNQGSRVLVLAWRGADAGKVSSQPVGSSDLLVVAH